MYPRLIENVLTLVLAVITYMRLHIWDYKLTKLFYKDPSRAHFESDHVFNFFNINNIH